MDTAILWLVAAIIMFVVAERSRRNIEVLVNKFVTKEGYILSFFAIPYIGKTEEARRAIRENAKLRRLVLMEMYGLSVLLFILSLWRFSAI